VVRRGSNLVGFWKVNVVQGQSEMLTCIARSKIREGRSRIEHADDPVRAVQLDHSTQF
jgi:hypothetical protein